MSSFFRFFLVFVSLTFTCIDAYGAESCASQQQDSPANSRGLYLGIFGGGGNSTNNNVTQNGTALYSTAKGGPLVVNAQGTPNSNSTGIGGLHVGYEWAGWLMGKEGERWGLLPAAEFEGYYLGTTQNVQMLNPSARIPEHTFSDNFPINGGVLLTNALLTVRTPYIDPIYPYVGAGVGTAIVSISGANSAQLNPPEPGINHFNSNPNASNWGFATQVKAGIRAEVVEHVSLFVEYRFLYISPTNYTFGSTVYSTHVATTPWNVNFGGMYYNMGAAGIEYNF
jgi:opacity protein-like surface antigen